MKNTQLKAHLIILTYFDKINGVPYHNSKILLNNGEILFTGIDYCVRNYTQHAINFLSDFYQTPPENIIILSETFFKTTKKAQLRNNDF